MTPEDIEAVSEALNVLTEPGERTLADLATGAIKALETRGWKAANADRCPCRGVDDMCPCQNDPELFSRLSRRKQPTAEQIELLLIRAATSHQPWAETAAELLGLMGGGR